MGSQTWDPKPRDVISRERRQKVERIFSNFDLNEDGGLSRDEIAALIKAVNPGCTFSEKQMQAVQDALFQEYKEYYLDGDKGLSLNGLMKSYDDGAGDLDRDFSRLGFVEDGGGVFAVPGNIPAHNFENREAVSVASGSSAPPTVVSATDENKFIGRKDNIDAWAFCSHNEIIFNESWKLIEALEQFMRKVNRKLEVKKKQREKRSCCSYESVEEGDWTKELWNQNEREEETGFGGRKPEDLGSEYSTFRKVLLDYRLKADEFGMRGDGLGDSVAVDAHLAMGRTLTYYGWYAEALPSFQRALELKPSDPRAQFRLGSALYSTGQVLEARSAYQKALDASRTPEYPTTLRPEVHMNLGILLESEGMLQSACDHYREAVTLSPQHFLALKYLGSALLAAGDYRAAKESLEKVILLKPNYADAHCDLGSALHAMGEQKRAFEEFQRAIDLNRNHVNALYNLGCMFRDSGKYAHAAAMYDKVLRLRPKDWHAQLNRAVSLLGVGDTVLGKTALKDAFKLIKQAEIHGAVEYLKAMQKRSEGLNKIVSSCEEEVFAALRQSVACPLLQ